MIYLTALFFVKEGKKAIFNQYEDAVLPLIKEYKGEVLYRIRPEKIAFISSEGQQPYEVHLVSFDTEQDLENYLKDKRRVLFNSLKDESIESVLLVKGETL